MYKRKRFSKMNFITKTPTCFGRTRENHRRVSKKTNKMYNKHSN